MKPTEIERLACPRCHGKLQFHGTVLDGRIDRGQLPCGRCGSSWRVNDGMAHLFVEDNVEGTDRMMRFIYNYFSVFHDMSVATLLPLFQVGSPNITEGAFRNGYMPRLDLKSLTPRSDGKPVRILEVGIGTGANLRYVRHDLPARVPVEIWGVDLSPGMLSVLRRKLRRQGDSEVRLLMADAHALPFPDHSFDRVFHVGGINGFRDAKQALAEMARVAIPGTPIVVADEQLDISQNPNLYHRAMFKMVTWYDNNPHAPVDALPKDAKDVYVDQLSLFLYSLAFRMPSEKDIRP